MRLLFVAIVLFSIFNFSHAFFGDKIIDKVQDAVHSKLGLELPQKLKDAYQLVDSTQPQGVGSFKNHSCNECVRHVSHHIINATLEAIKTFCSNTSCPKAKEHCEWMADHKNFTLGYLVQKIRPLQQSFLFCAGEGRCPVHPDQTDNVVEQILSEGVVDEKSAIVHVSTLGALSDASKKSRGALIGGGDHDINEFTEDDEKPHKKHNKRHHKPHHDKERQNGHHMKVHDDDECHECLKSTSHKFLKHVFKGLKAFCKKAEGEKWKRRCEFTFKHKDFSAGYLTAKLQPFNFAAGYCFGNESCEVDPDQIQRYEPVEQFNANGYDF